MQAPESRDIARQSRRIHGWFSPGAAGLFALVDAVQQRQLTRGDVFEIGAHHGKSAVMLARLLRADETLGVCDVFGSQDQNVSGSGSGDREIFDANLRQVAPSARVMVYEKLSSDLTTDEIGGPYRFFHVDGGHLAEEALFDMDLGRSVLAEGGVIAVDDPFRPEWPGVTEAILAFLDRHEEFVPIALGFNKLILARAAEAEAYRDAVNGEAVWEYVNGRVYDRKVLPVAGHDTPIFLIPTFRQAPALEAPIAHVRHGVALARRSAGKAKRLVTAR